MKHIWLVAACAVAATGCAHVKMDAPKEPIKLDVSMRLDIYQHIENDIDRIENRVNGQNQETGKMSEKQSLLDFIAGEAHASELGPEADAAISRRQDRHGAIASFEQQGVLGENRSGLLELRAADTADSRARTLVQEENSDRMTIYQAVAQKNGGSVGTVQDLYAKRLQADAPPGTPVEKAGGWTVK